MTFDTYRHSSSFLARHTQAPSRYSEPFIRYGLRHTDGVCSSIPTHLPFP